ncbi:hypothetical protein [Streptomyces sp. NRRL S-337]|uniref:hypothetical protein n=1 Tax=Streptomyces sp. NRRL S-337 TaxID=1463900 RepID=UPI0004C980B6|nr:hypothetical protein [Streptomyces sp. NRRL S-337]
MIKTRIATAAAAAALVAASIGLAAPAGAAPVKASGGCWNTTAKAKETLKIRTSRKISGTAVGLIPKGATGCYEYGQEGQRYSYCGKSDNMWDYITYRGMKGYVPHSCII